MCHFCLFIFAGKDTFLFQERNSFSEKIITLYIFMAFTTSPHSERAHRRIQRFSYQVSFTDAVSKILKGRHIKMNDETGHPAVVRTEGRLMAFRIFIRDN
jgi:hypothetical protein